MILSLVRTFPTLDPVNTRQHPYTSATRSHNYNFRLFSGILVLEIRALDDTTWQWVGGGAYAGTSMHV